MIGEFLGKEELVWSSDKVELYVNDLTRDCTKKARAMDIHGIELRGWTVYKAVSKEPDGEETTYVIFDSDNRPFKETTSIWDMYDWIVIKKKVMSFDFNIVDMAEKKRKGEE